MCLFCSKEFKGGYDQVVEFFNHMSQQHQFNVGHPDNMVFINEFIEDLRTRLESLQCLSCIKCFKDRATLKDHMRKKSHRALNKDDRSFDKYYVINYLEIGKRWTHLAREAEIEDEDEDWLETPNLPDELYCFFCEEVCPTYDALIKHMYDAHDFEYEKIKEQLGLSYYQQLKLVNWIRFEKHNLPEGQSLDVMDITEKILAKNWNAPQYYFPTFQNDAFLHSIQFDESIQDEDQYVYPEELGNRDKIRRESVLKDLLNDLRVEKISDNKKSRPKPKKPKSDPLEKQITDDKKIDKKPAASQEKYKPKKINAEKYQPPSKQRSKQLKAEKS